MVSMVSFWTDCWIWGWWYSIVLIHLCYSRLVIISVERFHPWPLHCGMLQGSIFSLLLINIYMKWARYCYHEMGYYQYANGTQLYFSNPGDSSYAMTVLSQCLEAEGVWMVEHRLQLNSGKTEWLWMQETPGSSCLSSFIMDGIALVKTAPVWNLGFSCTAARRASDSVVRRANFVLCAVVSLPGLWGPAQSHSCPSHFSVIFYKALYMGATLKQYSETTGGVHTVLGAPRVAHIILPLHKLHWLPFCFWVQFQLLVIALRPFMS